MVRRIAIVATDWIVKPRNAILTLVILVFAAAGAYFALVWQPAIAPIARFNPQSFPLPLIERGATLAAIGDCAVCHTTKGGVPYAGSRPLPTPFGTLYTTNITPDVATGIGNWSFAAFRRAMHRGVARDGSYLYPALPYGHFSHVNDDDLNAIYTFLMTRTPVTLQAPRNALIFPLGFRPFLAGWNLLFLHSGPFVPDPNKSAEWNRGAYLAEGLGHCAACHTPLNALGGEEDGRAYAGGAAEGWSAPPLNARNPEAARWNAASLYTYLKTGMESSHSAAAGPMGPVTQDLSTVPDADVKDIAIYIASIMQAPGASPVPVDRSDQAAAANPLGATLFTAACSGCHGDGAPMLNQGRPALSAVGDLEEDDPSNVLQAILQGVQPPVAARGPYMPGFADNLTDQDIAALAAYLRTRYSTRPVWPNLATTVSDLRREDHLP